MIITRVKVTKFRGFENQEFFPGNNITIITGKNGTQKRQLPEMPGFRKKPGRIASYT